MAVDQSFMGYQPSKYTLLNPSETVTDLGADTRSSWNSKPLKLKQTDSFISVEDLNRQRDSYMVVSQAPMEVAPLPKNTKGVVKWSRVILLLLRVCSWLGVAGVLACVICIRTVGTAMDWFMRIPPPVALIHLTYAIYHLLRPVKTQSPLSSANHMICAAILDSCLIPFQVLLAILAHNQLSGTLDEGTRPWTTIFGTESQTHIIVYSTYLISIATGGLLLFSFGVCVFLAIQFRRIERVPPYMNPFEDNLTARRHQKANVSISTTASEDLQKEKATSFNVKITSAAASDIDFTKGPNIGMQNERERSTKRSKPNPPSTRGPTYSALPEHTEDWGTHPPTPPESPSAIPPQFRHLRQSAAKGGRMNPAPLLPRPKYDFTNRSPRPLGLHPPTPRQDTHDRGKSFDTRALRNINGNSSAIRKPHPGWDDIELENDFENYPVDQAGRKKHYGDVVGVGRVMSNQARVVSSGMDKGLHHSMQVRMREVSGKIAEEGRGGLNYTDF